MDNYIKGKGIFVGTYTEKELDEEKEKIDIAKMKEKTGLKYINSEFVRKKGKVVAIKFYVCTMDDMNFNF